MREKQPASQFKSLVTYYCFEGAALPKADKNPSSAICVPAGQDKFGEIGEPDGAGRRANTSLSHIWKEVVESTFERTPEDKHNAAPKILSLMAKYPDDKVDAMRR